MSIQQVMTTEYPQWTEFRDHLAEMCHLKPCDHTHNATERALESFGFTPEEVAASLEYFKRKGGFCDCEILMNVCETADVSRFNFRPLREGTDGKRDRRAQTK